MPELVWDQLKDRVYETGLDRGVLYLPDGSAVPWNGLTSVIEHFDQIVAPAYYDGMKIADLVVFGDFSATMKAVTYPEEFVEIEGSTSGRRGLFYTDQGTQTFALCYRTSVGNAFVGDVVGYKIHLIYNVTAKPSDKTFVTLGRDPNLVEFEWAITAVPEEVPGFSPTAHIILDSRDLDPWLLEELETMLYGSSDADAALIPMPDFVSYIDSWYRIKIVDNGDGTWSATSRRPELIDLTSDQFFTIFQANAVFLDEFTFEISDTLDISDVPEIKIIDNGDGSWTAVTDQDGLFTNDGVEFEILNANAIYVTSEEYRVSDTTE